MDLGGTFVIDYFHRKVAPSYLKGVVDEYRAFSDRWEASRDGEGELDTLPPVPLIAKAVSMAAEKGVEWKGLTTNPLFAGLDGIEVGVEDKLNIEMGRMIKRDVKRGGVRGVQL